MMEEIYTALVEGQNICVLGPGGSGKTTACMAALTRLEDNNGKTVARTATTGVAAVRIGGTTLHSFIGLRPSMLGMSPEALEMSLALTADQQNNLIKSDILFVDEVSMLSRLTLDTVDKLLRISKKKQTTMGGMNVVLCGDFWQLPPVPGDRDDGGYAFMSTAWRDMRLKVIKLECVVRYRDDTLSQCIIKLGEGVVDSSCFGLIEQLRYRPQPPPSQAVTLCGRNDEVDAINAQCLAELPYEARSYVAVESGKPKGYSAARVLTLKVTAPVILTANIDLGDGIVNGAVGVVSALHASTVDIDIEGKRRVIKPFKFVTSSGSATQLPLKLCWARTVHRAQAMTFAKPVHIVLDSIGQPGQLAVALSRCTDSLLLSVSGPLANPPARQEVLDFYNGKAMITEPLDSEEILPRRNKAVLSGEVSDVVRAYLERAHQEASKQNNPHDAYMKMLCEFYHTPECEYVLKKLGRIEGQKLIRQTRETFCTELRTNEASQSETSNFASGVRDDVDYAKLRKMAGYFAFKVMGMLREEVRRASAKKKVSASDIQEAEAKKSFVEMYIRAGLEEASQQSFTEEIDHFQNHKFSLTHVKDKFFSFIISLDDAFNSLQPSSAAPKFPQVSRALRENEELIEQFRGLGGKLPEAGMKSIYVELIRLYINSKQYEARRVINEKMTTKRAALRDQVDSKKYRASTSKAATADMMSDEEDAPCFLCKLTADEDQISDRWIKCDKCKQWVHQKCLKVTKKQFDNIAASAWRYSKCI